MTSSASAQWNADVAGIVKDEDNKKRLEGAVVTIKRNGAVWKTITVGKDGKIDAQLPPQAIYLIEIAKPGYVTKRIGVNTKNIPAEDAKYGFDVPFDVSIFKKVEGLDVSVLNQPIAKFEFNPESGYLEIDGAYTKSILKELDKLKKELAELNKNKEEQRKANQKKYDALITQADKLYNAEKWAEAKPLYKQAEDLIPDESYPMFQLGEIEDKLAALAEANKRYTNAIAKADAAFGKRNFDLAIIEYQKASGYNPEEQYPKDKIKEIKDQQANEKKIGEEYAKAIVDADNAFSAKNYEVAKTNYQKATELKSHEEHPKTRLAEIDKLLAGQQKLEADYKAALAEADGFFTAKDYDKAITSYTKASGLKPTEQYPKDKIAEANKILGEQEKLEADYKNFIAQADQAFSIKDYSGAKMAYQQATAIKSDEQYPKDKSTEIDGILAELAKAELEAKQKEADYLAAVENGDKAFAVKNYELAQQSYQSASDIKTEEKYPKDRLTEIAALLAAIEKENADKKAKEEKYQALIVAGDKLLASKDYENAKGKYKEATTVEAEEQYPKDKITEIDGLLADLANAAAAEKEKEEKYQALIAAGDKLLASKDYENAKGKYKEATTVKTEEQYPKDKITEIDGLLADLANAVAAEKAKEEKYQALIVAGDKLLASKDYENAKGKYKEATSVKTEEQYPKDKITEIDALLALIAKEKAEKEAKEKAAAELKAKYDGLIAKADQNFGTEDYQAAQENYAAAMGVMPTEQYPKDKIAEIEALLAEIAKKKAEEEAAKMAEGEKDAKYKEAIELADNAFSAENYKQSIVMYNEALSIKPTEQYPKDRIKDIEALLIEIERKKQEAANANLAQNKLDGKYLTFINEAEKALLVKDYQNAKTNYSSALGVQPSQQYPKDKIKEIEAALAEIAKKEAEGNLAAEAERKKQEYFAAVIAQGDEAFTNKNYTEAKSKYTMALAIIPDANYPTNKLKEIETLLAELAEKENANATQKAINEKYDGLITAADNAFLAKDYATAKIKYNAALGVKPNESYPPVKLDEIDAILAQIEKEKTEIKLTNNALKQKQERYDSYIKKADNAFVTKQYKGALDNYGLALDLMPLEQYPKDKIAEINQILNEIKSKDKANENAVAAEKAKKEKYKQLIFEADRAFKFKKYESAKTNYTSAWALYPQEKYPPAQLAAIEAALKKLEEEKDVIVVNNNPGARAKINDENEKAIEARIAEMLKNKDKDKLAKIEEEKKGYQSDEEIRISSALDRRNDADTELATAENVRTKLQQDGDKLRLKNTDLLASNRESYAKQQFDNMTRADEDRTNAVNELEAIKMSIQAYKKAQDKRSNELAEKHAVYVDAVVESQIAMSEAGEKVREKNIKDIEVLVDNTAKNDAKARKKAEENALDVEEYKEQLSSQEQIRITSAIDRSNQKQRELDQLAIQRQKQQIKKSQLYKLNVEKLITFKENLDKIQVQQIEEADKRRVENAKAKEVYEKEYIQLTATAQKRYNEDIAYLDGYKENLQQQEVTRIEKAKARQEKEAAQLIEYKKSLDAVPSGQEERQKKFQTQLEKEQKLNSQFLSDMDALQMERRTKANAALTDVYVGEKKESENAELAAKYPDGVTEETIETGNAITIKRTKVTGNHVDVYERVFYTWGGNYFYKNGTNITKSLWDKETIEK